MYRAAGTIDDRELEAAVRALLDTDRTISG